MFGPLKAILWLDPAETHRTIWGSIPEEIDPATLIALRGDKPVLRRFGERMGILIPVRATTGGGGHVAWLLEKVPPVTDLPAMVEEFRALSPAFVPVSGGPAVPAPRGIAPVTALALSRLSAARRLRAKAVGATVADACVEAGIARAALVLPCTARPGTRGIGPLAASDQTLEPMADEIREIVARYRPAAQSRQTPRRIASTDLSEEGFDAALIGRMMGAAELLLDLPPQGQAGVAVVLIDPVPEAQTAGLPDLVSLALRRPVRAGRSLRARVLQGVGAALLLAALVWLALPAPLMIGASALSKASHAEAVALPFDAFIREMAVDVGQHVEAGDLIAEFSAPDLEEQKAQAELELSIEEVTAQAALSQNDYGAYVMSQQKQEALHRQIEQLESRVAQTRVTAPVSGQVIATLGNDVSGRHVPTGTEIVEIQPDDDFSVLLTTSRVDAPLLAAGQKGEVYFRGLAGTTWPMHVTSPVAITRDPQTGEESLITWGHIDAPGAGRLFVGLSGFARIEAGQTIRAYALSRYIIEFIKVKAWTFLGLHL